MNLLPYQVALNEYGVSGIAGIQNEPRILQFFKDIGAGFIKDDETAWCACFMNWCLKQAGRPFSALLNARQFLTYGSITTTPKLGDIVVLWRISPQSSYGHVGFFISKNKNGTINILGGNEDNQVEIKAFASSQVLQYRSI